MTSPVKEPCRSPPDPSLQVLPGRQRDTSQARARAPVLASSTSICSASSVLTMVYSLTHHHSPKPLGDPTDPCTPSLPSPRFLHLGIHTHLIRQIPDSHLKPQQQQHSPYSQEQEPGSGCWLFPQDDPWTEAVYNPTQQKGKPRLTGQDSFTTQPPYPSLPSKGPPSPSAYKLHPLVPFKPSYSG